MENIQKKIAYVSIGIGVLGLFTAATGAFVDLAGSDIITNVWRVLDFFSANILLAAFSEDLSFLWFFADNYYVFDILGLFVKVLLVFGAIVYLKSQFRKKNLLLFCISVILVVKFMMIIEAILTLSFIARDVREYSLQDVIQLIHALVWAILSFVAILKLYNIEMLENVTNRFATKWERFIHFIIDSSICTLVSMSYLGVTFKFNNYNVEAQLLIISVVNICYYISFEMAFGSTPGKFLTGSKVVVLSSQKMSLPMVVVRTISRLIPFEVLSIFFCEFPWHDRISKTKVLKRL